MTIEHNTQLACNACNSKPASGGIALAVYWLEATASITAALLLTNNIVLLENKKMTLFATLTDKGKSSSNSSSCSPPEAIQLHGNKFLHFLSSKIVNLDDNDTSAAASSDLKHFSALSYQAVQTQRDDVGSSTSARSSRQHLRPDLGIWDCHIQADTNADNTAMLLQRVIINKKGGQADEDKKDEEKKEADSAADETTTDQDTEVLPPTVVLTVDTTNPNSVQPTLEQMRNVLVTTMMSDDNETSSKQLSRQSIKTSTSMKVLQSFPFGVTKITESVVGSSTQDSSKRVSIIIAAIVASSSSSSTSDGKSAAEEYKERQAKSLVLYHLHKFALECDCTLCFVSDNDNGDDSTTDEDDGLAEGIQKLNIGNDTTGEGSIDDTTTTNKEAAQKKKLALSIDELGKVIRRVALGLSPVEEQDLTQDEGGESKTEGVAAVSSSEISAIHAPASHDAELIHGAYLRNASCEGQWDASKDDLIVALPPPQSTISQPKKEAKESTTATSGGGDEEWLSKLAASVGLTPEAITASSQGGGDAAASSTTPSGKKSPKRDRPAVKKRTTRATTRAASSKGKDGKPKDQKEVMNFFDDLLKK